VTLLGPVAVNMAAGFIASLASHYLFSRHLENSPTGESDGATGDDPDRN